MSKIKYKINGYWQEIVVNGYIESVDYMNEDAGNRNANNWRELDRIPNGAIFETKKGIKAVKTRYHYPNGQWECVLLTSGEYAHFSNKNKELVKIIPLEEKKI